MKTVLPLAIGRHWVVFYVSSSVLTCVQCSHVRHSPDVCAQRKSGVFVKSFHKRSILGETDFLMEALITWSLKRKYLWQDCWRYSTLGGVFF